MIRPLILFGALALGSPLVGAFGDDAMGVGDTVVAVVNDEAITRQEVLDHVERRLKSLNPPLTGARAASFRRHTFQAARQSLIDEALLLAEARQLLKNREPFAKRIEQRALAQLEQERHRAGGYKQFRDRLRKEGLTREEYVAQIRRRTMREFVLYQFVHHNLSVSPEEVTAHYKKHISRFQKPAQAKYRQIFLRAVRSSTRAQARKTAADLMELLKKEHDFARLARQYSQGPHAEDGGLWDFTRQGARPKLVDDAIFSTPAGGVAGPVETELGFTIIKVLARRKARTIPCREVLEQLEEELLRERRQKRYAALIRRLEREHYVQRLP